LDIMVPNRATGDRVAAYLRANGSRLSVGNVLWWVDDHYDHVHVEGFPLGTGTPSCAAGGAASDPKPGLGKVPEPATGLEAVAQGIGMLLSGEVWLRFVWGVGGFLTLGAGVLMLAKEMGVPVPSPVDVGKKAVSVATKGVL
jgi:hypothetical protein